MSSNSTMPSSVKSPQFDVNSHAPIPTQSSHTSRQSRSSLSGNKRSAVADDNNKNDASLYSNYTNNDGSAVSPLSDKTTVQNNNIHPQHESSSGQHNNIPNHNDNTPIYNTIQPTLSRQSATSQQSNLRSSNQPSSAKKPKATISQSTLSKKRKQDDTGEEKKVQKLEPNLKNGEVLDIQYYQAIQSFTPDYSKSNNQLPLQVGDMMTEHYI